MLFSVISMFILFTWGCSITIKPRFPRQNPEFSNYCQTYARSKLGTNRLFKWGGLMISRSGLIFFFFIIKETAEDQKQVKQKRHTAPAKIQEVSIWMVSYRRVIMLKEFMSQAERKQMKEGSSRIYQDKEWSSWLIFPEGIWIALEGGIQLAISEEQSAWK